MKCRCPTEKKANMSTNPTRPTQNPLLPWKCCSISMPNPTERTFSMPWARNAFLLLAHLARTCIQSTATDEFNWNAYIPMWSKSMAYLPTCCLTCPTVVSKFARPFPGVWMKMDTVVTWPCSCWWKSTTPIWTDFWPPTHFKLCDPSFCWLNCLPAFLFSMKIRSLIETWRPTICWSTLNTAHNILGWWLAISVPVAVLWYFIIQATNCAREATEVWCRRKWSTPGRERSVLLIIRRPTGGQVPRLLTKYSAIWIHFTTIRVRRRWTVPTIRRTIFPVRITCPAFYKRWSNNCFPSMPSQDPRPNKPLLSAVC